jgi:hypothetical protein
MALAVGAAGTIVACGGDTTTTPIQRVQTSSSGTGNDTSGQHPTPTPTSGSPAASVVLTPHVLTLSAGYYGQLIAVGRDANGVIVTQRPTWRSSNAAIADVLGDTGVVQAKTVGTTYIYATLNGHTDSATVVVSAGKTPPPPQGPAAVAAFNLVYTVYGAVSNADTNQTAVLSNVVVKVSRLVSATGDTLHTSDPIVTATTDASGIARFTNLPGGAYHIDVVPPADSPYRNGTAGIGPPTSVDATARITLLRKP